MILPILIIFPSYHDSKQIIFSQIAFLPCSLYSEGFYTSRPDCPQTTGILPLLFAWLLCNLSLDFIASGTSGLELFLFTSTCPPPSLHVAPDILCQVALSICMFYNGWGFLSGSSLHPQGLLQYLAQSKPLMIIS